ncbi:MAG: LPS export ABC transporter permease LptG [Alphaproteobacteria bacterium]|nr:LPS export ABC transporter permease LptG [Alphaproteobacteria bacterium]
MSWSWTLYRYLATAFLGGVGTIYGAFLVLAFSIDAVDLLNRTAGREVSSGVIVGMAILQLPDLGQKLLPFAILLGGVFTFARLSRNHELVATRAAGVSAWDFLAPPLVVAVALGFVAVCVVTPVSSDMLAKFSSLEAKYIKGQASQLAVSENGLWLRQGDAREQSVIHAERVADQGVHLEDVIVFRYGENDHFVGRISARSAQLHPGAWEFTDAWASDSAGTQKHFATTRLATTLTPSQIQESFAPPDTVSFWALPQFIRAAQNAGFAATRYQLYLYTLLALPILFAAMVFMAASFSLRVGRTGSVVQVVLTSALSGFAVYFFSEMTRALGQSGILPTALAATAPAAAAILIGMTLVLHQEDG